MNKKAHICPYCGSSVEPITNSDILKAVGEAPNLSLKKIKDDDVDYSKIEKFLNYWSNKNET